MSRQFRRHKPRIAQADNPSLFEYDSPNQTPQYFINSCTSNGCANQQQRQVKRSKHSSSPSNAHDIFADPHSDSLNMQTANYTAAHSFIKMSGFDDISPFITQPSSSQSDVSSLRDNNFNDYNEQGPNNINDSDYRQRMIRQMQQSVFEQSNAMFGHSEKTNTSTHPITESTYDASGTYSPSAAPSLYLQQQSKSLFKSINNK